MTSVTPESPDRRVGLRAALSRKALRLQSDRRLVALTRAGSGAAFSVIVERYRAPLIAYCRRLLGPDDAEDALQQTLVNALGALRRDDRAIELRPWLYRIAHNVAVNTLRRSGRHYEQLDDQYDGVPQPPDILDEKIRIEQLVRGIDELPARQREAVIARELEGRSYEEIARNMDATAPVVRQLIYRARTRLRDACGVVVPVWALRWMLVADLRTAGSERVGEAVTGGAAGAGLLKAGTALLATGAIATGAGGLVTTRDHHRAAGEARAAVQREAGPGSAIREADANRAESSSAEHAAKNGHRTLSTSGRESARQHGEHDRRRSGSRGDDRGDAGGPGDERGTDGKTRHDGDDESSPDDARQASHDESGDEPREGDSHGDEPSEHSGSGSSGSSGTSGSSERSDPAEDSGSSDSTPDEPPEP